MSMHSNSTAIATETAADIGRARAETLLRARSKVPGTSRRMTGSGPVNVSTLICETDDTSIHSLVLAVLSNADGNDVPVDNVGIGLIGGTEESSKEQAQAGGHE